MPLYMVSHTMLRTRTEFDRVFDQAGMRRFAEANAANQFPAQCLKTWDPGAHGGRDRMYCLWEGPSVQAVRRALEQAGISEFMIANIDQVDETDWSRIEMSTT